MQNRVTVLINHESIGTPTYVLIALYPIRCYY